jgi:2-hydroxy-6-oxonona-2,4-dienedioate hydrolase
VVKVWMGGAGEPLLLLHGGWGGAELHWSPVWDALGERFRVIAPELPGVGDPTTPGLPSFDAYAGWLVELLSAVGVVNVYCVGNSLGGAIAWQLAARLGERCRSVVLVNGLPPRATPALVRALAAVSLGRRLLHAVFQKLNFSSATLARAFADPALAPVELTRVLADPPRAQVDVLLGVFCAGARTAPHPAAPILLAWGEADRLPGTGVSAARQLHRALAGSRLVLVASAGHCPQLERPGEFVEAIFSTLIGQTKQ